MGCLWQHNSWETAQINQQSQTAVRACLAAVLPRILKILITLYSILWTDGCVMICDVPTHHTWFICSVCDMVQSGSGYRYSSTITTTLTVTTNCDYGLNYDTIPLRGAIWVWSKKHKHKTHTVLDTIFLYQILGIAHKPDVSTLGSAHHPNLSHMLYSCWGIYYINGGGIGYFRCRGCR